MVMAFQTADDRLSRAVSAVWRLRTADPDPMGDPSGDCGDLIAAWERRRVLAAVAAAGYATPGAYNTDLRHRMTGPDGKVSWRVNDLLSVLEVDACPQCGGELSKTSHYTRAYGGGYDTFERCVSCDYAAVHV